MTLAAKALDACRQGTPYARNTVTTAERIIIPAEMVGEFCWFSAETQTVYIRFGDNTVVVDQTDRSGVTSEAITPHANAGEPHLIIHAGTTEEMRLDAAWARMSHVAGGTDGVLRFGLASGNYNAEA